MATPWVIRSAYQEDGKFFLRYERKAKTGDYTETRETRDGLTALVPRYATEEKTEEVDQAIFERVSESLANPLS